ncbi:serine hydrolase domain-containing protein [uncultured Kriegella sp.]|uniref:serine hydrolase domain-containing protein n=1 Tax=uncultured Kriegella sp. TaxID=1798910 RepID=UPI0030D91E88|tara:strand:+ start:109039 stop:110355 length:1317 start_codon:yes stop_codon:yes gene_type:complete
MQRLKILVGCTLLILAVFFLTLSATKPEPTSHAKTTFSAENIEANKKKVDQKEVQRYKQQQQELQVELRNYFKKAIAEGDIVGAGVSIVQGDSIVISDGFGKRNTNMNDLVTGETVFRLGSLSKGFAGVLAANVKQEGKLAWTDKVIDYLPEFRLGDSRNTNQITLANILSHTSGTPYHSFTNLVEAGLPMTTIAERFKEVVPISKPGLMYSYQNAMFALCGEMMRKATGQKINTLLNNRFFKPLEMCNTTSDFEALAHESNVALPHSKRGKGWRTLKLTDKYYNAIAAGGISSNAHDMGRWMRFLLGHNPDVLNKSALEEAFNPFVEIAGHSKYYQRWPGHVKSYYGFGWRIHKFVEDDDDTREKTIWHHGGSVNSYRNEIALYPEADLGICVLLNSHSRLASNVIPDLYEIVKDIYEPSFAQKHSLNHGTAAIELE